MDDISDVISFSSPFGIVSGDSLLTKLNNHVYQAPE